MFKNLIVVFVISVLLSHTGYTQNTDHLKAINIVWSKFYSAFETLDHTLMAEIHSKDLVRVSGGNRILDYNSYINNYKIGFERNKAENQTNEISLRFFERINNDSVASERGIYKLIINKESELEQVYYGQFHVILKKIDDAWKIILDYDSSESNTIGEKDYIKAFAIDDFETFTRY